MADYLLAEVRESVMLTPGIKSCAIEVVFEPLWDRSMLSDEARIALGFDPEM
jgi:metal-sulfur cluster biosynthetic enzyme